jgi:nitrate/TMAO reductase-like tetraheme cytochrome c subunit
MKLAPTPRWWRWFGLRRRNGRFIKVVPTPIALVPHLAVLLTTLFAFAEYSNSPSFCRNCHIMEPYYQDWVNSSHRDVSCVTCHFEPGIMGTLKGKFKATSKPVKFITGTYGSKPHANVSDASCLRSGCHDQQMLKGRLDWVVHSSRGEPIELHFDHTPHLADARRGKQLRCVSCHSQIAMGEHIRVTAETCYLCHFKGLPHGRDDQTLGGCRSCHDAPQHEIRLATGYFRHVDYVDRVDCENCHANTISGSGEVPRQLCWTCHNQPQQIAQIEDPARMHQIHVTEHKVECSSCHMKILHELDARPLSMLHESMAQANTCGQCHQVAHNAPLDMYRGTGGRGVVDMPSPMYRTRVECIACHRTPQRGHDAGVMMGQNFLATQDACDNCHDLRYTDALAVWDAAITEHLARADTLLAEARGSWGSRAPSDVRQLLADAEYNLAFVRNGKAVHNMNYATALLNAAMDQSRQAMRMAPEGGGP